MRDSERGAVWLLLRGKAMLPQAGEMLALLEDVLNNVKLDYQERFRQIVLEEKASLEASLLPGGHRMVNLRVRAHFNRGGLGKRTHEWAQLPVLLARPGGASGCELAGCAGKAADHSTGAGKSPEHAVQSDAGCGRCRQFPASTESLLEQAAFRSAGRCDLGARSSTYPRGLSTLPAQVNYVAKGADLYTLGYRLHGSAAVIVNYLRSTWLWEKVRVQGGAYSGLCAFDHRSGVFTFLSYRDPQLAATLKNYDQSGVFLRQLDEVQLSQNELIRSIIGAIGDMDAYQLPDAKGYTSMVRYLVGDSDERRQLYRDQLLSTRLEDFHAFGAVLERAQENGRVAVLGSEAAIEAANRKSPGWLEMRRVQ